MKTGTDQLLYERRGARAYITFNRPEARNAMTWEMYEALYACCEEVDRDACFCDELARGRHQGDGLARAPLAAPVRRAAHAAA